MEYTLYRFSGRTYYLCFTAEALFTVYDKFGTGDILKTTHCMEPTAEGWKNLCWLAALMAAQGELKRRRQGYDPAPMLNMEDLRTGISAADSIDLRAAVHTALEQGFRRSVPDTDEDGEVNLVLREREAAEKKAMEAAGHALATWLRQLFASISSPPKP